MERLYGSLVHRTRRLTLGLAIALVVALPVAHFTAERRYLVGALEAEAAATAHDVSRLVTTYPDSWRFQLHRLEALLDPPLARELGERRRVLDRTGTVLIEVPGPPTRFLVTRDAPLFDSGVEVGRLEIARPVGSLLARSGLVAALAAAFGLALLLALRMLPLRALARSEDRFRAVVESASDAILLLDERGQVLSTNASGAAMFARPADGLVGVALRDLIGEGSRERLDEAWRDVGGSAPRAGPVELDGVRADGASFPLEITLSGWREGGEQYRTAVVRDVTERRRAAEALASSEEQLRQAQRLEAVGRLAAGVAHDFNNLLSVMLGRAEMALSRLGPQDAARRDVEAVRRASERAADLTRQLLAFARKQVLEPRVLDLNAVVTGVSSMLRRLIREDVAFSVEPGSALGLVKADPGQIEQVLMNLVVNARDAMPRGGALTIATANADLDAGYASTRPEVAPGPYVMIAVSDTGYGMDAATQARIFEPFFTTKEEGKGTGLGLSTVYGIIRQSGGHVAVESEPGRGTTFRIYLPCFSGTVEAVAEPAPAPRGQSEVILLVEDEDSVRGVARDILEAIGYRVLEAAGPGEAIEIARRQGDAIDLLLTDVVMPVMNGRELAARLVAERAGLGVLYMSGYARESALPATGTAVRSAGFLEKPFTADSLAGKVRDALAGRPAPDSRRRPAWCVSDH